MALFYRLAFVCMAVSAWYPKSTSVLAVRSLRIASPLQSLTIPDPEVKESIAKTRRHRFLPRFKAGLQAEVATRKAIAAQKAKQMQEAAIAGDNWAEEAASLDAKRKKREERIVEREFEKATARFDEEARTTEAAIGGVPKNKNNYQFVGVVNPKNREKPITWYARKKPPTAKWSVRLVHVNRDAIIKDLFNQGKVDIFANYKNTGKTDEATNTPIVLKKYSVRERSWKNLWNFSPKNMITDSSGMYWRERRLRPGMYTDGSMVYESSYRYKDGRNGMHRLSTFQQYLNSKTINPSEKERILKRLKEDTPDIVLEE